MRTYKRVKIKGGCYFFTVNLQVRYPNDLLVRHVDDLREAFRTIRKDHPFQMDAVVIMPDHLHCIWQLPEGDDNFSQRWALIKARFSRQIVSGEPVSNSRRRKGERGIWQRRFWEHAIRDEMDYHRHVDYIHYNPVKHGYVDAVHLWPYSSFKHWVKNGYYDENWGCNDPEITGMEME